MQINETLNAIGFFPSILILVRAFFSVPNKKHFSWMSYTCSLYHKKKWASVIEVRAYGFDTTSLVNIESFKYPIFTTNFVTLMPDCLFVFRI